MITTLPSLTISTS